MSNAQATNTADADFAEWAARIESELGSEDVDVESYRRYYKDGLSAAEAVRQERLDADVI